MYPTCASCTVHSCQNGTREGLPQNCPMRSDVFFQETTPEYLKEENHRFYVTSTSIEGLGYGQWTRLRETVELCKAMGYRRVGLAFCAGLRREAKVVETVLRRHGLEVVSVICKTGGIPKEDVGIPPEGKIRAEDREFMCNPIAQAKLLNAANTELNIALGLCVGHDSLFYKYSDALVTTLVAKDRVLAHNPVGAVYCAESYYRDKL